VTDETELDTRNTALVAGAKSKVGHAIVTNRQLVFFDTKFMGGSAGGVLGAAIASGLQKRHEDGGPLVTIPVESITGITRQKKLLSKDRVEISTTGDTYVFSDGWEKWSVLLRDLLTSDYGKTIADNGTDSWSVSTD
jgi:hypothetical protein